MLFRLMDEADAAEVGPDLAPAKDRAATARSAIEAWINAGSPEEGLAEMKLRFEQWVEVQPYEALYFWDRCGLSRTIDRNLIQKGFFKNTIDLLATKSSRTVLEWLQREPRFTSFGVTETLAATLGRTVAAEGKVASLSELLAGLDGSMATKVFQAALNGWPEDRIAELDPLVQSRPDMTLVKSFIEHLKPEQRLEWLKKNLEGDSQIAKFLRQSRLGGQLAYYATGASMDERAALLAKLTTENGEKPMARPDQLRNLIRTDLENWLTASEGKENAAMSDWKSRFRDGELSAQEVMAEARKSLGLSDAESNDLKLLVFKKLSSVNPTAAFELLSDLPFKDREAAMLDAATQLGRSDPKQMNDLLALMPMGPTSGMNDRFKAWMAAVNAGVEGYGDSYAPWILSLPHGVDRDMGLSALASAIESKDPTWAAELRAAKTLPVGWQPGQK